ncbi:hypothetical protein EG833_03970 [archaeon]|nr:hypothetical protein [archaeon]
MVVEPASWIAIRHMNRFGKKPHLWATQEHWTQLVLSDTRGDALYMTEEFNTADVKSGLFGIRAVLFKELTALHEIKYDYLKRSYVYSRQGLTWTDQCWTMDLYRYVDTSLDNLPRDTTIGVTINLLGLGQVVHTKRSVEGSSGQ